MAPSPRGRQVNLAQATALLLAFVLTAGVGGLLTAGTLLPAIAVAKGTTDITVSAFDNLPSELVVKPLSEKSTMLDANGNVLAEFYAEDRIVVPLDEIAPVMRQAVIATEDKRFYEHGGIDPTGMLRAAVKNAASNVTQGASTLTQQYVKNVLLETAVRNGDAEGIAAATESEGIEGYSRKLREAKLAISLEKVATKDQILENYLNIAQFGISVYGVEAAAQKYFSTSAADLTYLQAATLAGVTQSPTKWDPIKNPENSQKRRNIVLQLMKAQGVITPEEYEAGIATPIGDTLQPQEPRLGCMSADQAVPGSGFFCDYVVKVIKNNEAFGETEEERLDLLYRGGLTITTTLDPAEQAIADTEVKAGIPVNDRSGVAHAMSVVEPGTGKITAMAQNRTYSAVNSGVAGETSVNYNTDQAYGGSTGFAPGSTFKAFTLLEWLKQGHSLSEYVDGTRMSYPQREFTASCTQLGTDTYKFGNAEGGKSGVMSVLDATRNSVNSAFIAMATQLDLCAIMDGAKSLGIHQASGKDFNVVPANVLGSDSVAPLTMAAAFATFASGGVYCEPVAITRVTDASGAEIPIPSANCTQAIEPQIADAMNYAMSNVWSGTAKAVGAPPFASAGKTGTTTRNENTWFVGYTPLRSAAVWVGYSEGMIPVQRLTVNGSYVRYMYGSTVAAPTWKRFMTQAMAGKDVPAFNSVDSTLLHGVQIPVPNVVGQSQEAATSALRAAGFSVKVATEQIPSTVAAGAVASQSLTGAATKGSYITLTLSNGQAPEGSGDGQNQGPGGGNGNNGNDNGNNGGGDR
ncbi:transglycosylase domain-containing protein [Cellulomonas cellasea]|uniref:transglycosylase domain-containing protein n=1 Tax=Cellulomonas cellasea TaxID=43670 RepID=UPI0025A3D097|nr:transglycosylase domain-containing protein [Cellulomonas cellasea]MDM8086256.1 transglycosylase domain-containing protein [Cellulomonas cellasea]